MVFSLFILIYGGIFLGKWFKCAFGSATATTSKTWSWCTYIRQIFYRSHDESVLAQMLRWMATAWNYPYGKPCNSSSCQSSTLCCRGKFISAYSSPHFRHKYCFGSNSVKKNHGRSGKHTILPHFSRCARRNSQPRSNSALFSPLEYT